MSDGTKPPKLLLIVGSDSEEQRSGTKLKFSGLTDLYRLLGTGVQAPMLKIAPDEDCSNSRFDVSRFDCVINLITEAELHRKVLNNVRTLLRDYRGRIINPPDSILRSTRDQVAARLQGTEGAAVPKVLRLSAAKRKGAARLIDEAGLCFPMLLRQAGTHTGRFVGRFDNLDPLLAALPDDGDHLLTEFVDFRGADGLYRKYRVFFIGKRRVVRHMLVSDEWNVHASDRRRFMAARQDLIAEEERLLAVPDGAFPTSVHAVLADVRERMGLDFFGMDFAIIPDGRLLLFEANATMNFFPFLRDGEFAYLMRAIDPAQQAMRALVGLPSRPGGIVMSDTIGHMGR